LNGTLSNISPKKGKRDTDRWHIYQKNVSVLVWFIHNSKEKLSDKWLNGTREKSFAFLLHSRQIEQFVWLPRLVELEQKGNCRATQKTGFYS
jgi:hypothetical protein